MNMNRLLLILLFVLPVSVCVAAPEIPRAYRIIADQYGIPPLVFFSIAIQESGTSKNGRHLPWPWTLNLDEKPLYFATREDAEHALLTALDAAKKHGRVARVAVGLGQIYMPAHLAQFESPLQALDPTYNLHYAAQLLLTHYASTWREGNPDWWVAVGRYHSPYSEGPARRYRQLVFKRCQKISDRCMAFGNPEHGASSPPTKGSRWVGAR